MLCRRTMSKYALHEPASPREHNGQPNRRQEARGSRCNGSRRKRFPGRPPGRQSCSSTDCAAAALPPRCSTPTSKTRGGHRHHPPLSTVAVHPPSAKNIGASANHSIPMQDSAAEARRGKMRLYVSAGCGGTVECRGRCWCCWCWLWIIICIDGAFKHWATPLNAGNKQANNTCTEYCLCGHAYPNPLSGHASAHPSHHHLIPQAKTERGKSKQQYMSQPGGIDMRSQTSNQTNRQKPNRNLFPCPPACPRIRHPHPTTAFMLRLSRNPPRSSFFTSTTQCSKLSILTRAFVSPTTS